MDATQLMLRKPGQSSRRRKAGGDAYMADAIDVMTERLMDASNHSRIDIGGAGGSAAGPYASAVDFVGLPLKPDHEKRPFWVTPTGSIFLEATSPLYEQARDFLVAICEPVSRPEFLHEYRLDRNALFAAASMGLTSDLICSALNRMSKVPVAKPVLDFVHACTTGYGKVKLVLQKGKYYLESSYPAILRLLNRHPTIRASRVYYLSDGTRKVGLDGKRKKQDKKTGAMVDDDDDEDDDDDGYGLGLLDDDDEDYTGGGAGGVKAARQKALKAASSVRGMAASAETYGFEVATSLAEAEGSIGLKGILAGGAAGSGRAAELSGLLRRANAGGDTAGGTLTRRVIGEVDSDEEDDAAAYGSGSGGGAGDGSGARSLDVVGAAMEAILGKQASTKSATSNSNNSNPQSSPSNAPSSNIKDLAARIREAMEAKGGSDGDAIFEALQPELDKMDEEDVAALLEAVAQAEITARAEERLMSGVAAGPQPQSSPQGQGQQAGATAGGSGQGGGAAAAPVSLLELYSTTGTGAVSTKMAALAAFTHATGATTYAVGDGQKRMAAGGGIGGKMYNADEEAALQASTKLSFQSDISRQLMGLSSTSSSAATTGAAQGQSAAGRGIAGLGKKGALGLPNRKDKGAFVDPMAFDPLAPRGTAAAAGDDEEAPPPPPSELLDELGEDSIAARKGRRATTLRQQAEKAEKAEKAAASKKSVSFAKQGASKKGAAGDDPDSLAQEEEEFAAAAASAAADQTDDVVDAIEEEKAMFRAAAAMRTAMKEEARETAAAEQAAAVAGKREVDSLLRELGGTVKPESDRTTVPATVVGGDPTVVTATVVQPQGVKVKLKAGGTEAADNATATATASAPALAGNKRPRPGPDEEVIIVGGPSPAAGTTAAPAASASSQAAGVGPNAAKKPKYDTVDSDDDEDDDKNDEDYDAGKDDDYKDGDDDDDEDYDDAEERKKKRRKKKGALDKGKGGGRYTDGGMGFASAGNKKLTKAQQEKLKLQQEAEEALKLQAASAEIFSHVASNEAASLAQFEVLYKRLHASTSLQSLHTPGRVERFEIDFSMVDSVKKVCLFLDPPLPLIQEYDFRNDTALPKLTTQLRDPSSLRPYQEKSLAKMFGNGRARSGIIVLPCGAGKTLVGISAATTIGKSTIILCPNQTSVQQWTEQLFRFTTVSPKNVCVLTAKKKEQLPPLHEAVVLLTTYTMIGSGGRGEESRALLNAIAAREWGCMLLDEVHQAVANTFSKALRLRAHCRLGLTATLVREDGRDKRLSLFIGPKLYEANWMDLTRGGYLANVQCMEVWCPMTPAFYYEYLTARSIAKKKALAVMNPVKCAAMDYLIKKHDKRGDKIIIFSESVFALRLYAEQYGVLAIEGSTPPNHREAFIRTFKTPDSGVNKLFLSRVGDVALDVPDANVIIQISSHFGSRLQEAQRMGRILRRGTASNAISGQNAFFYTLVSTDTLEMYFANKRRRYLVDQGYAYKVLMADKLVSPAEGPSGASGESTAIVPAGRKPRSLGEVNAVRVAAESEGLERLFAKASFMSTKDQQRNVLESIAKDNLDDVEGKEDSMMAEEQYVNEDDLQTMQRDKERASNIAAGVGARGAGGGGAASSSGSVLPPTRSLQQQGLSSIPAATRTTYSGLDALTGGGKSLQYLEYQSEKSGFDALREAEEMAAAEQRAQREALLAARASGKAKSQSGGGDFGEADPLGMW